MKLNDVRPTIETSGNLEEQFFSIQDQGMIFDILRNKMYSNPILAICREITCNARDAHREVGTPEVPVQVYLPNNLEPYYKVKDFGPGISPNRMSNIFIKYTASTKRLDNVQTGGFGLGAKTPFSYSDTFSIVTNFDGVQYNYSCFIDETKVGKLILMSESKTSDVNGTEIIIPVKPKNFGEFATWTEQACRHWEVKPTVKGNNITWQSVEKILKSDTWAITKSSDWQRQARMVIDGIEYPLELETLRKYADGKLIDSARGNFVMYFGVGELSLSASRENIYLDERTQNIIRNRLNDITKELQKIVVDKLNAIPNLWEANIFYRKELKSAFNSLSFLGTLTWNGIPISDQYLGVGCSTFSFHKGKYSRKNGTDPNKLTRSLSSHMNFDENSELYINDLPLKEPTPRHVKKAFEDNPKLTSVQIICPNDKVTLANLNASIHLDKMEPKLLSSITKASGRTYTPATSRLLIFKFDNRSGAFRQVSYASLEEDTSQKVICTLSKANTTYQNDLRQPTLKSKKNLGLSSVRTLTEKFPQYSFYGVDSSVPQSRLDEEFADFEDIELFIKNNIIDNKKNDYIKIKFANKCHYDLDNNLLKMYNKVQPLIKNSKSLYLKRLELHARISAIYTGDTGLLHIFESINGNIDEKEIELFLKKNPEFAIDTLNREYKKTYPLLNFVTMYSMHDNIQHIAEYVNLIDNKDLKEIK